MEPNLENEILDALYDYFQDYSGSPEMMFSKLCNAVGMSPQDRNFHYQLFSLKEKEWIVSQALEDGQGGMAFLTPAGIKIAKDRMKTIDPHGIIPELYSIISEIALSELTKAYHASLPAGNFSPHATTVRSVIAHLCDIEGHPLLTFAQHLADLPDITDTTVKKLKNWSEQAALKFGIDLNPEKTKPQCKADFTRYEGFRLVTHILRASASLNGKSPGINSRAES